MGVLKIISPDNPDGIVSQPGRGLQESNPEDIENQRRKLDNAESFNGIPPLHKDIPFDEK